jgi:hypothetical protein
MHAKIKYLGNLMGIWDFKGNNKGVRLNIEKFGHLFATILYLI